MCYVVWQSSYALAHLERFIISNQMQFFQTTITSYLHSCQRRVGVLFNVLIFFHFDSIFVPSKTLALCVSPTCLWRQKNQSANHPASLVLLTMGLYEFIFVPTQQRATYLTDFDPSKASLKYAGISFQMSPVFWTMNVSKIGSANRNLYRGF